MEIQPCLVKWTLGEKCFIWSMKRNRTITLIDSSIFMRFFSKANKRSHKSEYRNGNYKCMSFLNTATYHPNPASLLHSLSSYLIPHSRIARFPLPPVFLFVCQSPLFSKTSPSLSWSNLFLLSCGCRLVGSATCMQNIHHSWNLFGHISIITTAKQPGTLWSGSKKKSNYAYLSKLMDSCQHY